MSLTVAKVTKQSFFVSLIPHTRQETALLQKGIGAEINIECDIIGKYVERLLYFKDSPSAESNIDLDFLAQNGFI